jgi:hypothetical protein
MAKAFVCTQPPLKMRVEETPSEPGWNIYVQLLGTPPLQATVYQADVESARKTAIAMAHALCAQHHVDLLPCLEDPQWAPEE